MCHFFDTPLLARRLRYGKCAGENRRVREARCFTTPGRGKPRAHLFFRLNLSAVRRVQGRPLDKCRVRARGNMEETVESIPDRVVRSAKADLLFGALKLFLLANMYWLWLSLKLGSLSMFVVGLIPVSWIVTGPVAVWALLFDVPKWVLHTFT